MIITRFKLIEAIQDQAQNLVLQHKGRIGPNGYFFTRPDHQHQYDHLQATKEVLTKMTEFEFSEIQKRIEEAKTTTGQQQNLFR